MSNDLMIAFLPSDGSWCQQDFPHMTLVWGGPIDNMSPADKSAMVKDAITACRMTGTFRLNVTGVEQLGQEPDVVDALIFYPTPQLILARKLVESWDKAGFSTYLPHATIGPAGSAAAPMNVQNQNVDPFADVSPGPFRWRGLPTSLFFNKIAACWGDERIIFMIDEMY